MALVTLLVVPLRIFVEVVIAALLVLVVVATVLGVWASL
jgi:hypothetical protein